MPIKKLKKYLEDNNVPYRTIRHEKTYTAAATASSAEVPKHQFAKSVAVTIDGELALVVLPADETVSLRRIRHITKARNVKIAKEPEFKNRFPDCEVGAMPPFGKLYDVPTFVSNHLEDSDHVVFNAGTHTEMMSLPYEAFERLMNPEAIQYIR